MIKRYLFVFLICLVFPFQLFAAEEYDPVVVTAEPIEDISEVSPGAVTVIDPEEYRGELKTLPDILKESAGIHIIEARGRNGYTVASIRGSTAAQVAVYLDGSLVNLGSDAAVDLSSLPLESIESIEVYRGYIPSRFAFSGLGAVINIVTRKAGNREGSLLVGAGDFGEYRFGMTYGTRVGEGRLSLSAEARGSDGNFPYINDDTGFNDPSTNYDTTRGNNGFDEKDLILRWESSGWKSKLSWSDRARDLPYPASGNDRPGQEPSGTSLDNELYSFKISREISAGDLMGNIYAEYREQRKEFFDPNDVQGGLGEKYNRYDTDLSILGIQASVPFGEDHFFEMLLEKNWEDLDIKGDVTGIYLNDKGSYSYDRTTFTLQDSIFMGSDDSIAIYPQLRWNEVEGDSETSLSLALNWFMKDNLEMKASLGRYYRAPNIYEKYGDGAFIAPNTSLEWEEGTQWDMGFLYKGKVREYPFSLEASYFSLDSENLIEFVMLSARRGKYENISDAHVHGVEISGELDMGKLEFYGAYTWMDSENRSSGRYTYGRQLPNRPENSVFARLSYLFSESLRVYGEVNYTDGNYLDEANTVYYDDLALYNVGLRYELSNGAILTAGVDDIFDEGSGWRQISTTGIERLVWYPLQGRTWHVSLLWNF